VLRVRAEASLVSGGGLRYRLIGKIKNMPAQENWQALGGSRLWLEGA
jgi:hypothetical protein